MQPEAEFLIERQGAILRLTINRPRAANAINDFVAAALVEQLAAARSDPTVQAVVLTGAGERAFCAGRDLKNPQNLPPEELARQRRAESGAYTSALLDFDKPLVAALNGIAIGAGVMLALHADAIVAAEHAVVTMPEVDIGIATYLGHALLAMRVSEGVASDLVLTGRKMPSDEALRHGLFAAVVAPDELAVVAHQQALALAAKPADTFRAMKQWILARRREAVERAYRAHDAALAR